MTNKSCPVSFINVDGNVSRVNAFYVGILFIAYLLTMNSFILYFLIIDFIIRLSYRKEYSLLFMLSVQTKKMLRVKSDMVDYAPKRLASLFGLIFLVAISLSSLANLTILFYILSIALLMCILLEAIFSYCLGCEIYHIYMKFVV